MSEEIPSLPEFLQKRLNQKQVDVPEKEVRLNNGEVLKNVRVKSIREIFNPFDEAGQKVVLEGEGYLETNIDLSFRSPDSNHLEARKYILNTKGTGI